MIKHAGYLLLLLLALSSCKEVSEPTVLFHEDNALLPKIFFTTDKDARYLVEYWITNDESSFQKSKESSGQDHVVILYNVLPATKYSYRLRDAEALTVSDIYEFTTQNLPADLITLKKEKIDTTAFDGYILMRKFRSPAADIILNNKGDVVWYNQYDTAVGRAFFWTNQNSILSTYDTSRIMDITLLGERTVDIDVRERFPELNIHHEILYDKSGNILTITTDCLPEGQEKIKSLKGAAVCGDGIIRLKPDGTIDWKWSILDAGDSNIPNEIKLRGKEPIGHANAIALSADGNYLISMRDFSQVWKVNSKSGAVMWKLGKGGDFKMPEESYFLRQHSIHINSAGELMMFDNGEKKERPLSRIVSFKLDEKKMEATPQVMIQLPKDLSSPKMCSAYNISDDKFLVCTSRDNVSITIVNKQGETLWRVNGEESSYRAYYIKDPFAMK
jgi:arylsulfate sulfotransferase